MKGRFQKEWHNSCEDIVNIYNSVYSDACISRANDIIETTII